MNNTKYKVNDIFETIQGEAKFTGTPSWFIRMQECPVGCPWCDTKFTWTLDNKTPNKMVIWTKEHENESWADLTIHDIYTVLKRGKAKHVVISGGEPCIQDLNPICNCLRDAGYTIQIETSGTYEIKCPDDVWVTLSPKIDMPGGLEVLDSSWARANEIKMPIGKAKDIDKLKSHNKRDDVTVWLQPLSQSKKATILCVAEAIKNNWKISVQTHKYINQK